MLLDQVRAIAGFDVRAAACALRCQRLLPSVYKIAARWTETGANQSRPGLMDSTVTDDFVCLQLVYQVRRGDAFGGDILSAQNEVFEASNPHIDILLGVTGGIGEQRYQIVNSPTAVELVADLANSGHETCWPLQFTLTYGQALTMFAYNRDAFALEELPVDLILVARGVSLGCQGYGGLAVNEAVACLAGVGIKVPAGAE